MIHLLINRQGRHLGAFLGGSVVVVEAAPSFYHNDFSFSASGFSLKITLEPDALGTPMQLVTPNGQPRWLAEPDDWAAVKNQRAVRNVTQPISFQGQWHDEESGLYYNRHRYYDPQQGRYISQDPIGLNGGTNLYGYVTNPTGMVDPLGLSAWETIKFHSRMIPRFIRDEGMDVLSRTATVVSGFGQVLLGGALCETVFGCAVGAPIAGLGLSNIQEGYSESGRGFARGIRSLRRLRCAAAARRSSAGRDRS